MGQFGIEGLNQPSDFVRLAKAAIEESELVVDRIVTAEPGKAVVADVDRVSDIICSVCDPANMCYKLHPDPEFKEAAFEAANLLNEYLMVRRCSLSAVLWVTRAYPSTIESNTG